MRAFPAGQAVLAGVMTSALGDNPRPVFVAAGLLIVITVLVAWPTALRHAV